MNIYANLQAHQSINLPCINSQVNLIRHSEHNDLLWHLVNENLQLFSRVTLSLKLVDSVKHPALNRIHTITKSLGSVLSNPQFYKNVAITQLAFVSIIACGLVWITAILALPVLFILGSVNEGFLPTCEFFGLLWYVGAFDVITKIASHFSNYLRSFYFYIADRVEDALGELDTIVDRFIQDCRCDYNSYLIDENKPSCSLLEEDGIGNKRDFLQQILDPITMEYFPLDLHSSSLFHIGRFVLPVRSLIEMFIKSDAKDVREISHPIMENRCLSGHEIEEISKDFKNFFSVDLKFMDHILKISLDGQQRNLFPEPEQTLHYIRSHLFYKYVAHKHDHFTAENIMRFDFKETLLEREKIELNHIISNVEKMLSLPI